MNKLDKKVDNLIKEKIINPYKEIIKEYESIIKEKNEIFTLKGKWNKKFNNNNCINLEIGCGSGNFLQKTSANNHNENYIGIEIRFKRIVRSADKSNNLSNILFIQSRAENIDKIFSEKEISNIHIYFPDPWFKKKHFKNRLLNYNFFKKICLILKTDGLIFIKTDHREYYEEILKLLEKFECFKIEEKNQNYYKDREIEENATEFEKMFYHKKQDVYFIKTKKKV